jgi:hypothetical protein
MRYLNSDLRDELCNYPSFCVAYKISNLHLPTIIDARKSKGSIFRGRKGQVDSILRSKSLG